MDNTNNIDYISLAKRVFRIESDAIADLIDRIDDDFAKSVDSILKTSGRTIICGMGKSGIIGKKIAATLASTGTPSFFMHPGEAYHGDLGMVTPQDVFIAISFSGETDEVVKLLPFLRDNGNLLIAITGRPESTLAEAANYHLNINVKEEACPLHLAPTSSTTATLVMGDALAIALMEARNFRPENFARFHPGGALGRRLLSKVENEMITSNLPLINQSADFIQVISGITKSSLGLVIVEDVESYAIITDGDIRRALEVHGERVFSLYAKDMMTMNPKRVSVGTKMESALAIMENKKISSLLIFEDNKLVGVLKK
ncbi:MULTISPECIES: KpsF/GutQ family sugar-phosphate isomerase [Enterobacteriaceae]|uniref:KpsF/GutQ family sugar-phosphate isomerase n=1 Tax=Enterobacteriaceae TaxID=543 RepID=UPI00073D222F|nr:KpsF/GutQ family sugar-phosphate isomerase [Entomohabitans teleogrylli]EHQ8971743.1 KpsF/GutQ family sugar-phosphate isomerase [Escherichia coli]